MVVVGLQAEPRALDLFDAAVREVDIVTTLAHVCDVDLPEAIALLATTDLGPVATDRVIPLEALVDDGLRVLAAGTAEGKIVVDVMR
jgi:(R,R)-butanediol dehydrogenase/meso-butanediol dehydrogenase/diacetyl reductase